MAGHEYDRWRMVSIEDEEMLKLPNVANVAGGVGQASDATNTRR
jgi:hypothetical protein